MKATHSWLILPRKRWRYLKQQMGYTLAEGLVPTLNPKPGGSPWWMGHARKDGKVKQGHKEQDEWTNNPWALWWPTTLPPEGITAMYFNST